ncbi:MAG: 23S rRNA (adenine(2503)-C(2))-methyltransferase RlmN [Oscillospiraceae bacterium]|nr:23S rRNA (adenine(2503)-C(2))-methyltransferase RlmN [Oscillospiraceae bacterium]
MTDLKSLTLSELEALMAQLGQPKFRAAQIFSRLAAGVTDLDELTALPKSLRAQLGENYYINSLQCLRKLVSGRDGTVKYLWELTDGNAVETVLMRYEHGNSVCISTQVGCRQGCAFCASTIGGLVRNLTAGEMLDEVIFTQLDSGVKISNIVLMGIGEPLDNYDNVLKFLSLVNSPQGMNIGMRHITLSTCGRLEEMRRLAEEKLQLTLAVSMHACDDKTRSRLMPSNRHCGVEPLVAACTEYFEKTGRRVTLEYAMIDGVNDTPRHAESLARSAAKIGAHVNLIPLNHVEEQPLQPSGKAAMKRFCDILSSRGVNFTLRRSLGGDVDASCGQLRRRRETQLLKGGSNESLRHN